MCSHVCAVDLGLASASSGDARVLDLSVPVSDHHVGRAGYHIIISRVEKETIRAELDTLVSMWGITSQKCFTTYDALRLSDHDLMWLMLEARRHGVTTMMHAESGDIIAFLTEKLEERGMTGESEHVLGRASVWEAGEAMLRSLPARTAARAGLDTSTRLFDASHEVSETQTLTSFALTAPSFHGQSRLPIAEGEATSRAIVLAELVQTPVLFVHVSAASAANAIRAAQSRGLPIFAETCPQYLHLTHADLERFHGPLCFENSKMLCSPSPGLNDDDQEHLWT